MVLQVLHLKRAARTVTSLNPKTNRERMKKIMVETLSKPTMSVTTQEAPLYPKANRERMAQTLFVTLNVPTLYTKPMLRTMALSSSMANHARMTKFLFLALYAPTLCVASLAVKDEARYMPSVLKLSRSTSLMRSSMTPSRPFVGPGGRRLPLWLVDRNNGFRKRPRDTTCTGED